MPLFFELFALSPPPAPRRTPPPRSSCFANRLQDIRFSLNQRGKYPPRAYDIIIIWMQHFTTSLSESYTDT